MSSGKDEARRIASYLVVGGSTALLELGLFHVLYGFTQGNVVVSNVVAVATATVCNFLLNRNVTFKSSSNPVQSMVRYAILFTANPFIPTNAISLLIGAGLASTLAKLITQCCVACWNYVLYKRFVFV